MRYLEFQARIVEPGDPVFIAEISGNEVLIPMDKVVVTRRGAPASKLYAGELVRISMPEDMAREKGLIES